MERYEDPVDVAEKINGIEILIGIPSKNVMHTIAYVLSMVVQGARKYLRNRGVAIVVCDGFSSDATVDIVHVIRKHFMEIPIHVVPNIYSKGKGGAVKTLVEISHLSSVEALVLLDSDLRSITPEWLFTMVKAHEENCQFVAPLYRRHRYDATITNFIARPMTSSVYGIDLRQPIGGDFVLGKKLCELLSDERRWISNPWSLYFGIDIFITHTALMNNVAICEADLKVKIHEPKDPALHLKNMFIEVTGSLFTMLTEYMDRWIRINVSTLRKPKLIIGNVPEAVPQPVTVDTERAKMELMKGIELFRRDFEELLSQYDRAVKLDEVVENGIPRELWSYITWKIFAKFFKSRSFDTKIKLLEMLYYLWQGRLYRYYRETNKLSDEEIEVYLDEEVASFLDIRRKIMEILRN